MLAIFSVDDILLVGVFLSLTEDTPNAPLLEGAEASKMLTAIGTVDCCLTIVCMLDWGESEIMIRIAGTMESADND